MLTGPSSRSFVYLAAACLVAGCAQPGPLRSRTTVGTLKTSLSHLQFENQQLQSKVASLESENRDIENRLVQEERVNGDLSARLDNARNLLSSRGYDWEGSASASTRIEPPAQSTPSRALPAGRSSKPRKPPFARIPGRTDSPPPADDYDDTFTHPRIPGADAFGPQSRQDVDIQWLPIARGAAATPTKVR